MTAVYLYVSNNSDTAMLSSMSSHKPLPLNLSSSCYWNPIDPKTGHPFFKKFAAQVRASLKQPATVAHGITATWWPKESPFVLCVGGTDLTTKGAGKGWASETVWVDGGGGISPDDSRFPVGRNLKVLLPRLTRARLNIATARTSQQTRIGAFTFAPINVAARQTHTAGPALPRPCGQATWLWPMNRLRLIRIKRRASLIQPFTHWVWEKATATDFHDITVGSNGFPATKGYDLATGWGSPNGAGLINALAK